MAASAFAEMVRQLIQRLPSRLLGVLDAWSHRRAQHRHQERMRKWQARPLAAATQAKLPPGPWQHLTRAVRACALSQKHKSHFAVAFAFGVGDAR